MFADIQLYKEPLSIYDKIPQYKKYCEMTEFEQAFLCGMIKEAQPKKLVEIGVSAGGTTAVILNCLKLLGNETDMYSCDLEKTYYRDMSKNVGFVAEEAKEYIFSDESQNKVTHTIMSGGYAPEFLPRIGKEIDFLILDTVHSLPGEMLDFLACLPYLKKGATVILHDISLNASVADAAYATKLVIDTVVAQKYFMPAKDRPGGFPNIAAFKITDDTYKYISSSFSALTISWNYMPNDRELKIYHDFLEAEYDKNLVEIYNRAVLLQIYIACRKFKNIDRCMYDVFINKWRKAKHAVIYGCGLWGRYFYYMAKDMGLPVDCFVISDGRDIPDMGDIAVPVMHISELPFEPEECVVLITVEKSALAGVAYDLMDRGYSDIY